MLILYLSEKFWTWNTWNAQKMPPPKKKKILSPSLLHVCTRGRGLNFTGVIMHLRIIAKTKIGIKGLYVLKYVQRLNYYFLQLKIKFLWTMVDRRSCRHALRASRSGRAGWASWWPRSAASPCRSPRESFLYLFLMIVLCLMQLRNYR